MSNKGSGSLIFLLISSGLLAFANFFFNYLVIYPIKLIVTGQNMADGSNIVVGLAVIFVVPFFCICLLIFIIALIVYVSSTRPAKKASER